jgi:NADPH:quinone reductase-like Zn-dependent oxidoreductase
MGETAISQGRVANMRVLITGAASGIGRATALLLERAAQITKAEGSGRAQPYPKTPPKFRFQRSAL